MMILLCMLLMIVGMVLLTTPLSDTKKKITARNEVRIGILCMVASFPCYIMHVAELGPVHTNYMKQTIAKIEEYKKDNYEIQFSQSVSGGNIRVEWVDEEKNIRTDSIFYNMIYSGYEKQATNGHVNAYRNVEVKVPTFVIYKNGTEAKLLLPDDVSISDFNQYKVTYN